MCSDDIGDVVENIFFAVFDWLARATRRLLLSKEKWLGEDAE